MGNKMIAVKLTKLKSNHTNLRTDIIEGVTENLPTQDKSFLMFGEGLEFGTRMVHTTPVLEIMSKSESEMEFKTKNSHYKLEIL
jgi:hypothetical protein